MITRQEKQKAADELATLIQKDVLSKDVLSKVFHRKIEKSWNEFSDCYTIRVWDERLHFLPGPMVARVVNVVHKYNGSFTKCYATSTIGARLRENGEPYAVLDVVIE